MALSYFVYEISDFIDRAVLPGKPGDDFIVGAILPGKPGDITSIDLHVWCAYIVEMLRFGRNIPEIVVFYH